MHIEQNAPPGASGGHTALAPDPWTVIGVPPGYEAALGHLKTLGRKMMEAVIAGAIDALDAEDAAAEDLELDEDHGIDDERQGGDINDEPQGSPGCRNGDDNLEPSLGAPERHPGLWSGAHDAHRHDQRQWASGGDALDLEEENEHGADDDAGEPMLGSTEIIDHIRSWKVKGLNLACGDGEPSLGSTNARDQTHWAEGRNDDREEEHDGREDVNEDHDGDCDAEHHEAPSGGGGYNG